MKRLSFVVIWFVLAAWASPALAFDHSHKLWDASLKQYVENGYVHYGVWKRNKADLQRYLAELQAVNIMEAEKWSPVQRYAFWINAYNALVVSTILDHYPFKLGSKIVSIRGMHDDKHMAIAGQEVSLDDIRDHILRKTETRQFLLSDVMGRDTQMGSGANLRVLLSICNGTITAAPLRSEAYVADRLDKQLDDQVRRVINSKDYLEVVVGQKTMKTGYVFKEFKDDFRAYSAYPALFGKSPTKDRGLLRFIFHYLPSELQKGVLSRQKSPWRFNFQSGNAQLNGGE